MTPVAEPEEGRETIEEQQERQAAEGLEHPAPSAVEEAPSEPEDGEAMEGPAPTG